MSTILIVIQIISILQGLFLGYTLFQRRKEFVSPTFWLFIGCIFSLVLFSIGDDSYNLFLSDSNWFFFHEPLMITFFFLFIRYINSDRKEFEKFDVFFFLPYGLFIFLEILSKSNYFEDNLIIKTGKELIEITFIIMLLYSNYEIINFKKAKWFLLFFIPFTLIFIIDEVSGLVSNSAISFFSIDSYGIFLVTILLFYFVTYKLIISPKDILPIVDNKYMLSKLDIAKVASIKNELNRLMDKEKLFKQQKLNVDEVATQIKISRQQLSEVLNVHMQIRFQDLLNQYRIEEFINCIHQDNYKNYTIFGIANEVGFSSKSSFNATFKKLKGITPSQYKKLNSA